MNFLRDFAYKTLTDKTTAIKAMIVEITMLFCIGYAAYHLDKVGSPLATPALILGGVAAFFVTLDLLITAFVVFTGKLKE